jgi:dCMP deaminase
MTRKSNGPRKIRKSNKKSDVVCVKCENSFLAGKVKENGQYICKECIRLAGQDRANEVQYWKRPEYKEMDRKWRLSQYGLSIEDYDSISERQGGVCAICKKLPEGIGNEGVLVVDHDHKTGKVRGLLCQKCNRAIGVFKEDYNILRTASAYLLYHDPSRSWDKYFVEFARLAATRSKDPSNQVGAVIVNDHRVISTGYNGFPSGVNDNVPERWERPLKYTWVIHAEENAILNACRFGISCKGASLYVTPFFPCARCATSIIQSGVKEVVVDNQVINPRFEEEFRISKQIFESAKVLIRGPE